MTTIDRLEFKNGIGLSKVLLLLIVWLAFEYSLSDGEDVAATRQVV